MKKRLNFLFAICFILLVSTAIKSKSPSTNSDMYINLDNIRNSNGVIYIFLYNYKNQYPKSPLKHYTVKKTKVKDGKLKVKLENIEFNSNYAIALLDDENNNKDLDRFLGLPTEGFGFSNNVKPILSLPDYKSLIFNFSSTKTIFINLQYFL